MHFQKGKELPQKDFPIRTYNGLTERLKYEAGQEGLKHLHLGQRKLELAEIEFLLKHGPNRPIDIIYVGAAHGQHIPHLASLFPQYTFHLFDPAIFTIKKHPLVYVVPTGQMGCSPVMGKRIYIYNIYFTNEVAKYWSAQLKGDHLFISDIRTGDVGEKIKNGDKNAIEKIVDDDMQLQRQWVEIMNPIYSSLKFRLPYAYETADKFYEYFDGEVFLQVWAPVKSSETRLFVPQERRLKQWDILEYDEKLHYFNRVMRNRYTYEFKNHDLREIYDKCYDCSAEKFILSLYLEKFGGKFTVSGLKSLAIDLTRSCLMKPIEESKLASYLLDDH